MAPARLPSKEEQDQYAMDKSWVPWFAERELEFAEGGIKTPAEIEEYWRLRRAKERRVAAYEKFFLQQPQGESLGPREMPSSGGESLGQAKNIVPPTPEKKKTPKQQKAPEKQKTPEKEEKPYAGTIHLANSKYATAFPGLQPLGSALPSNTAVPPAPKLNLPILLKGSATSSNLVPADPRLLTTNVKYHTADFMTKNKCLIVTNMPHFEIVQNVIDAINQGLKIVLGDGSWPATAQDFAHAVHMDNIIFAHDDGHVGVSQYLVRNSEGHDLYLCFMTFCTFHECPYGPYCRYRHAKLELKEVIAIAMRGAKAIAFLQKYVRMWNQPRAPICSGFPEAPKADTPKPAPALPSFIFPTNAMRQPRAETRKCDNCGQVGHLRRDCPQNRGGHAGRGGRGRGGGFAGTNTYTRNALPREPAANSSLSELLIWLGDRGLPDTPSNRLKAEADMMSKRADALALEEKEEELKKAKKVKVQEVVDEEAEEEEEEEEEEDYDKDFNPC